MVHFPRPFQKDFKYFWVYRNFVLSDALSELPNTEETKAVVNSKAQVVLPILKVLRKISVNRLLMAL